jgi:hypothetical protein
MEALSSVPRALEGFVLFLQAREELVELVVVRTVNIVRQLRVVIHRGQRSGKPGSLGRETCLVQHRVQDILFGEKCVWCPGWTQPYQDFLTTIYV